MRLIGKELGKMHNVDIIHGDLTTSNMLLRRSLIGSSRLEVVSVLQLKVRNVGLISEYRTGTDRLRSFVSIFIGRGQGCRPLRS